MKNQNNLDCAIVRDLLPLYHDGAVSEDTKQAVAAHLADCDACTAALKSISEKLPEPTSIPDSGAGFRQVVQKQKKKRRTAALAGLAAGAVLIAGATYFLRNAQIMPYSADDIKVRCVHHYQFDDCKYDQLHDPAEDHGLFIWMNAPWIGNINVTHENGVLEMNFVHQIWRPDVYGVETKEGIYTVNVLPGDKVLKINGKQICEIGEPEQNPPGYVWAEHALCFAESGMEDITADTIAIMNNSSGGYTKWDISGNVLDSTGK